MSNEKKTILEKIATLISSVKFDATPIATEPAPVELMKVTDASGNEYEVESLEVGKVMSMGGVPVPAGEYTVAEGATVITCGEGGVITEIIEAKSETTEAEPVAEVAHAAISIEQVDAMIKEAAEKMKVEYQKQIADLQSTIDKNSQSTSLAFEATKKAIEVLAEMPINDTIHVSHGKIDASLNAKDAKRADIKAALKELSIKQ